MPVNGKESQRDSISLETPPMENLQEDDKGEAYEESLVANSQNGHPAQAKDSNDDHQQEDEEEPLKNLTASDGDGHVADPDLEPESTTNVVEHHHTAGGDDEQQKLKASTSQQHGLVNAVPTAIGAAPKPTKSDSLDTDIALANGQERKPLTSDSS